MSLPEIVYSPIDVLKTGENGDVQLVYDKIGKQVCIFKQRSLNVAPLYEKLKALDSRYIPKIFRLIEREDKVLIVEEYVNGQTLSDILKYENFFDEKLTALIFRQICEALRELHAQNIIHRDIKPSNIMLTRDKVIRLIDFSISRIVKENADADTEFLGTRGFAPPEQFGFGQTDSRSDIYSLGVTAKILLGKNYSGWLTEIVTRCTKLDPENRYQSIDELLDDFDRLHWKHELNQMKNSPQFFADEDLTGYEKFDELIKQLKDIDAIVDNYCDADKNSVQKRLLEQSLLKISEDIEETVNSITEDDIKSFSPEELENARKELEKFHADVDEK